MVDVISLASLKISSIEESSFSSIETSNKTIESDNLFETSLKDVIALSILVFSLLSFCESSKSDQTSSFDRSLSI